MVLALPNNEQQQQQQQQQQQPPPPTCTRNFKRSLNAILSLA
jgi:hypothetical protein